MRIGFDAKRAFSNKSGLGNYSRDVIRSLQDIYPEHEYVLYSPEKETELLESKYQANLISSKASSKAGKLYWRSFSITKDIINSKLDIYHGLSNELPFNIGKINIKKIVTIHDLIFLEIPSLYPFIDRKIYLKKFEHACKVADKIIATSNQTKNDIIKHFGIEDSKIHVIYQSCNERFKIKITEQKAKQILEKYRIPDNYILNVGTIETRKNVLNIVKAIYYFNLDVCLVIVGRKTPYYDEIKSYVNTHNMQNKFLVLGNVSNEDLPAIYQNSRVFVYPSVYEGFGIPILEAFNSGIPVITSDNGSPAEIAGDAAIQVEALNSKAIGIAIRSVLQSSDLANALVRDGYKRAKLFDREIVIKKMMSFYNSL
jgi:glycosyltransferase involved in cell wall biosynthesis